MKIALISCSKLKQNYPCSARELYAPSQLFSLSYEYAKRNADAVYILSAKYGLLAETDRVAPYDLTLSNLPDHWRRNWASYVLSQMRERFDLQNDTFFILAGQHYYQYLLPRLAHVVLPLGNLRMGDRLSFLQQQLADTLPAGVRGACPPVVLEPAMPPAPAGQGGGTADILAYICGLLAFHRQQGETSCILTSGEIHRAMGLVHRMPSVCSAMYQAMGPGDVVVHTTPSGKSSTIQVRYSLAE